MDILDPRNIDRFLHVWFKENSKQHMITIRLPPPQKKKKKKKLKQTKIIRYKMIVVALLQVTSFGTMMWIHDYGILMYL